MTFAEHGAAARIAWRHARRAKGRTALVLFLVAFPIMALAGAGFVIKTAMASPEDRAMDTLGTADIQLNSYMSELTIEQVEAALPPGTVVSNAQFTDVERVHRGTTLSMRFQEPSRGPGKPPLVGRYALLRGRMPATPGESTLHPGMLETFGNPKLGSEIVVPELDLRLRFVGVAIRREGLRDLVSLLASGTFPPGRVFDGGAELDWLIDLPPGASIAEAEKALVRAQITEDVITHESVIAQRRRETQAMTAGSFAGAIGALFGTGLIAAAAFGVGARRQLRTLGLVGAAGGEPRHVRATVLWGGTVVGLVGSGVGVLLGIALAFAARPHMSRFVPRMVDTVRLPWLIIAGAIVLGTVAATLAAYGPARRAARLTTVDALAGRLPGPKPPGGIAVRGLVAVGAGGALMGIATAIRHKELLGVGTVIVILGFLFAIPLLVSWVGHLPTRLPTSIRLAARQTARHGRRTGAAVAAATLALTAPVAIGAYSLGDEAYNASFIAIAPDQVILRSQTPGTVGIETAGVDWRTLPQGAVDAARRAIPGAVGGLMRPTIFPERKGKPVVIAPTEGAPPEKYPDPAVVVTPAMTLPDGSWGYESSDVLVVGDAELLRALGADAALRQFERGSIVAIGVRLSADRVDVRPPARPDGGSISMPIASVGKRPAFQTWGEDVPRYVVSEAAARRSGLGIGPASSALLRAPHDLSKNEIGAVKDAVAPFSRVAAIVRSDLMFPSTEARLLVTGAAVAVALIIVAVAIALIGAETRRDRATLVAVGAGPGMRRRTAAAAAFLIAGLAAGLAIPAGLVPVAIVDATRTASRPLVIPWSIIGLVGLGAPLIAATIAALSSREPSSRALLQPVW